MRDTVVLLNMAAIIVGGLVLGVGFIVVSAPLKVVGVLLLAAVAIFGLGGADYGRGESAGSAQGSHAEPGEHAPHGSATH